MKKLQILFLLLLLLLPVSTFAQRSTANKSWNAFWSKFSTAVNKRNKVALKSLMASEKDFFSGGGGETRDEWIQMVEEQRWWGLLQKSVRLGVKADTYDGKPGRVTKDNHLVFAFIGGKWRFMGPMGD